MALVELEGITKVYPGVIANEDVSLAVEPGEVMAVLGENGAGKSTLMKILFGYVTPDRGTFRLHGEPVRIRSPRDATRLKLGMVSQEFMLVGELTVAENVALASEETGRRRWYGRVRLDRVSARITELSERYGLAVAPDAYVRDLSIGLRQRVEIVKALYHGADVLILDEPTAVLTPDETRGLFNVIRELREAGKAVLLISHKLDEVLAIADRVTVLRHGRVVARYEAGATTKAELSRAMVGTELTERVAKRESTAAGERALSLRDVTLAPQASGGGRLQDMTLEVAGGEILGIAGVEGNGQTELAEVIAGLRRPDTGEVTLLDRDVTAMGPREVSEAGLSYIPADRGLVGVVGPFTVAENLILKAFRGPPFASRGVLQRSAIRDMAGRLSTAFDIRMASEEAPVAALSGGNLQKVILARELGLGEAAVIVAMHPTRGLDVKSTQYVH
ncbi:MAG: ral nucleoside transport system ATP-binding protein, partial [Gaiellales bacterium]|nr:ral nucleoside transport system ATP-binding protein [Gaiellales bacterium]